MSFNADTPYVHAIEQSQGMTAAKISDQTLTEMREKAEAKAGRPSTWIRVGSERVPVTPIVSHEYIEKSGVVSAFLTWLSNL